MVMTFVKAAIARGEKAALFIFDEELGLLFDRMKAMGIDLEAERDKGNIVIEQIDAAELSPGEFAHRVRRMVDDRRRSGPSSSTASTATRPRCRRKIRSFFTCMSCCSI